MTLKNHLWYDDELTHIDSKLITKTNEHVSRTHNSRYNTYHLLNYWIKCFQLHISTSFMRFFMFTFSY